MATITSAASNYEIGQLSQALASNPATTYQGFIVQFSDDCIESFSSFVGLNIPNLTWNPWWREYWSGLS